MGKKCELHKNMGHTCDLHKKETGYEKGVHRSLGPSDPSLKGAFKAGTSSRMAVASMERNKNPAMAGRFSERSKEEHKRVLNEMKKMPKPNLDKSEKACTLHKKEAHKKHMHELHKHLLKSETEDGNHKEGYHDPKDNEQDIDDGCPYCEDDEDNRVDDCAYCQDLDAEENADGTAGMDNCPECQAYDEEQQETGGIDTDNCPYCDDESMIQANPDMNGDQSDLAVEDMIADRPDDCPECQKMYSQAIENQPDQTGQGDPNLQGHETAEEVLDMLDQEPGAAGITPEEAAKKIDNTEMPQGDAMEDGTAVTENFGDAQKNDISDADQQFQEETDPNGGEVDEPDMAGVLQAGLDEHASEQKKQQVLDMVGQTLAGFKANKQSLEATKEQNQPLYNSCIQMLKSMIELCKLLGLEPQMPEQKLRQEMSQSPVLRQDGQTPPKAAPSEGAAEDPKTQAG